jgi:hypothetical protein
VRIAPIVTTPWITRPDGRTTANTATPAACPGRRRPRQRPPPPMVIAFGYPRSCTRAPPFPRLRPHRAQRLRSDPHSPSQPLILAVRPRGFLPWGLSNTCPPASPRPGNCARWVRYRTIPNNCGRSRVEIEFPSADIHTPRYHAEESETRGPDACAELYPK